MESKVTKKKPYDYFTLVVMIILAILFAFPLYWIITGSFKDAAAINAVIPEWFPKNPTSDNSPQLFAAYHVFLRLLVPRHPPCALISLTN